ncbi:MAG: protoporphyrinogen oxidase [Verrucomicrobia bacterium]|nr:protoporphyrinogen oxidase [Verrucomicrobiota bacterium]
MSVPQTVIVGGGITGLATAFYLERRAAEKGLPVPSYTLIEAGDRLGGKIVTQHIDDYVLEGGPDSFIAQKPWGLQLCRDLGVADALVPCSEANQKIYMLRKGRLVAFPRGLRLGVPTEFLPFVCSRLFSPLAKLRMGMELFIPPRRSTDDESVGAFMARRLGREASRTIAGPMMAGIYVADPERLSIASTFPMFVDMERKYGSLIRAMFKAKRAARQRVGPPPAMFVSPRPGMQEIVNVLVPRLTGNMRTGTRVSSIRQNAGGFEVNCADGSVLVASRLVMATPAYITAELLEPLDGELARRLAAIRYVASALVARHRGQPFTINFTSGE